MEISRDDFLNRFYIFEEYMQDSGKIDRCYKNAIYFHLGDFYGIPNTGIQGYLTWNPKIPVETQDWLLKAINESIGSEYLKFKD